MKAQVRFTMTLLAVAVGTHHAQATSLSTGLTLAAPGTTVTVPIDLVNPSQVSFTSIDAAVRILSESGNVPQIIGFNAPLEAPFVWQPFSGVTYIPAPNNPLSSPLPGQVLGVAGSDQGVLANMQGRVMDVSISVPASASLGTVYQVDLIEDLSFISNGGSAEHFSDAFQDGTLKIVTPQILTDYNCVQSNLFTTNTCGDLTGDGLVDGSDFNAIMNQINALPSPAPVPEPNLAGWMAMASLMLLAFRRKTSRN